MYIIKDWTNNICFNGIEFNEFEDAWGFLYEQFRYSDDDLQEYEVVQLGGEL